MWRSYSIDEITFTSDAHRLGRTCIHKVGQYYVKPGQIQSMGTGQEKEDDMEQGPLEGGGGVKRSDFEGRIKDNSDSLT